MACRLPRLEAHLSQDRRGGKETRAHLTVHETRLNALEDKSRSLEVTRREIGEMAKSAAGNRVAFMEAQVQEHRDRVVAVEAEVKAVEDRTEALLESLMNRIIDLESDKSFLQYKVWDLEAAERARERKTRDSNRW